MGLPGCHNLLQPVATCRNLSQPVATCRNLSQPVATCRNLSLKGHEKGEAIKAYYFFCFHIINPCVEFASWLTRRF